MIYMDLHISWRRNESSIMRDWHWNWKSPLEEFASVIIWGTFCRELIIIICRDCVNFSGILVLLKIRIGLIQRLYHSSSVFYYYLLLNLISISRKFLRQTYHSKQAFTKLLQGVITNSNNSIIFFDDVETVGREGDKTVTNIRIFVTKSQISILWWQWNFVAFYLALTGCIHWCATHFSPFAQ